MTGGVRPWAALAGLCTGILWGGSPFVFLSLGVGACAMAARRKVWLRVVGVGLIGFACGSIVSSIRFPAATALERAAHSAPRCDVRTTVLEELGGLGTLVAVDHLSCGATSVSDAGVAVVDDTEADPGALIAGSAWVLPLGDDDFDSARRNAGALARLDPIDVVVRAPDSPVHRLAAAYRSSLRRAVSGLEPRRAGLLLGLTIGETRGLDETTVENFRRAGLSHLVAVSGSNVAIVIGAVLLIGSRWSRRARLASAVAILAMFVLVVGPDPSVLRAAVMAGIMLLALRTGVTVDPLRALGLALMVLMAIRPGLVSSVGLHLSAAATAGIVLLAGPIARRLTRLPRSAALAVGATLGAQLAVLPLLIAYFEQIPLAGPIANLVAMPAVAPATVLGLAGGAVGSVAPSLGGAAARVAEPFAGMVLWSADTFGGAPRAAIYAPAAAGWPTAAVVAALVALAARSTAPSGLT